MCCHLFEQVRALVIMSIRSKRASNLIRSFLIFSLSWPQGRLLTAQQTYPVVVTPGTPSIWSMEQAHYLLGRLRANNDRLLTEPPSPQDLNPNATHGLRLDALRTALGVSAELDDIKRAQNRQTLNREKFNADREPMLIAEADALRVEVLANEGKIAALQGAERRLTDTIAITPTERTAADTEKLRTELAKVKGDITELQNANKVKKARIADLEAQTDLGGLKTTEPPKVSDLKPLDKVLQDSVRELLKKTTDNFDRPKLHSTIVLDNFMQMQYEILAKQLAILRDEVGAGQRVIFLEMPTSINAAGRKIWGDGGEDKLAQSWWKVNRIMHRYKIEDSPCFAGEARYERFAQAGMVDGPGRATKIGELATQSVQPATGTQGDLARKQAMRTAAATTRTLKDFLHSEPLTASLLFDQHNFIAHEYQVFSSKLQNLTAESNEGDVKKITDHARNLITKLASARRTLESRRAEFIARIPPNKPKTFVDERVAVGELEAPCRYEHDQSSRLAAMMRDLSSDIREELGKKGLSDAEEKRLEYFRDKTIPAIRNVLDDRLSDLLAIHQAKIYEYFGGPELISSAFVSDIASSDTATESGRESGQLRAVELIPRQTALNVNSTHANENNSIFSGAWKALFGFGLKVDYQRQREQYDQFIQQEAFASGFGKGRAVFGWTFGPLPGTRVLNSGTRNTYAALIVPDDASALEIEGMGCAFNYKDAPPASYAAAKSDPKYHCSDEKLHALVGIPDQDNSGGFWLSGIDYAEADEGARSTVIIRGSYISPQTTVLINGRRLPQVLGIGKPAIHMDADSSDTNPEDAISGAYELVDQHQLAIALQIPKGYSGEFPQVTLVAPSRAAIINHIRMPINGRWGRLYDHRITPAPPKPKLSLSSVRAYGELGGTVRVQMAGALLHTVTSVMLNGLECVGHTPISAGLLQATCTPSDLARWEFLAVARNNESLEKSQAATHLIDNPTLLGITSFQINDADVKHDPKTLEPVLVPLDLIGFGFTPNVQIGGNGKGVRIVYKSPTMLSCEIDKPAGANTRVSIVDSVTGKRASIDIPTPDKKKAEPKVVEGETTITTVQSEKKTVKK